MRGATGIRRRPVEAARRFALALAAGLLVASAPGTAASAAVDTEAPSTPGPITVAEISYTTITLNWAASTDNVGVSGYEVVQFTNDVGWTRPTPTNSITIEGLSSSRTYRFWVRARDAAGNSSLSTPQLVVTMPPGDSQAPTVPSTPRATSIGDTTVVLTWTPSTDNIYVALYEVLLVEATGSRVVATAPQHPPTGPTATVRNLTPGTTYYFAVRARDDAGNTSEASAPVKLTTTGKPPATGECAVAYRVTAQWPGGFQADVQVRNDGPAELDGWTLSWEFAAGQRITQLWGAVPATAATPTGTAVSDAGWNRRIPVAGTVAFGFTGSWTGSNAIPASFRLGGTDCAVATAN